MLHSGQICMSTERVVVEQGVAKELMEKVKSYCEKIGQAGDVNEGAKIGPLFTEGSAANIVNLVKEAVEHGAECFLGDMGRQGAVVQPHLLRGVKPGMRAWDEESFGPSAYMCWLLITIS